MSRPPPTVLDALAQCPRDTSVLAAVSGGIDSVVLLHLLHTHRHELRLQALEVVHVDHALRSSSVADANWVRALAERYELPFHAARLDPSQVPTGENLEAWGRRQRYAIFSELRVKRSLALTATAHQADDQVETLLMRIIAARDLSTLIQRSDLRRALVRPLLCISRDEIRRYADEHSLSWVEDETNADESRLRNRVRHSLLPLLRKEYGAAGVCAIAEQASALAEDAEFLSTLVEESFERLKTLPFGDRAWLSKLKGELLILQAPLRWRLIERVLLEPMGFTLGRRRCERVLEYLESESLYHELLNGVRLRRKDGGIELQRLPRGGGAP